jgi:acyl-CoA synthetase (NDP forming)
MSGSALEGPVKDRGVHIRSELGIAQLLRPQSVAFVGVSSRSNSAGRNALDNFLKNEFGGTIHVVGRSDEPIAGYPCLSSIDDLPDGIDLAVLSLPGSGVLDAVQACCRKGIKAAVVFASGFAELGGEAQATQAAIEKAAHDGNLALLGPNCIGLRNYHDRIAIGLVPWPSLPKAFNTGIGEVALVGQSGGLLRNAELTLQARNVPVSHYITTGNEAVLDLAEFIEYFASIKSTAVVAL